MKVYESQKVKSLVSEVLDEAESFGWYKALVHLQRRMTDIPEIDAEPVRHGRWIHSGFMEVKCSNCGNVFHELEDTNYCPNCGAKMIPTIPKEIIDAVLGEDEVDDEDN